VVKLELQLCAVPMFQPPHRPNKISEIARRSKRPGSVFDEFDVWVKFSAQQRSSSEPSRTLLRDQKLTIQSAMKTFPSAPTCEGSDVPPTGE
jgi:hypothetical protein